LQIVRHDHRQGGLKNKQKPGFPLLKKFWTWNICAPKGHTHIRRSLTQMRTRAEL